VTTIGVEEEFLLLDPATGVNVPAAEAVLERLPEELRPYSRREFRLSMIEMVTPVCAGLAEVERHLKRHRRAAAEAAAAAGCLLVPVGATPIAEPVLTVAADPRYREIAGHYGPIVGDPAVCGCHVHVGVPDRAAAVRAGNHLRGWLPVIQALGANSPFHDGADTGHASWRSMQLDRWPTLGPSPRFASVEDFDRTVEVLVSSGAMLDESLVLWHTRPSARYPTVEVRVADVCLTPDDTVLLAGLIRGLVSTGEETADVPDALLRAAHWNAAHQGMDGTLLDPRELRPRPAWELAGELLATVAPALERHGDLARVEAELARVRREGTGARRQREMFRALSR
jgi:carboxylate-amine ligase